MLKINFYQAGKGDCFLATWNNNDLSHRLIIDFGISGTYRFLSPEVENFSKLDAVLVTHVDYDHIGGFFKWLSDQEQPFNNEVPVYMNTPSLILTPSESNMVGIDHGVNLEQLLLKRDVRPIPIFMDGSNSLYQNIHGLQLQVLSPNKTVLSKLLQKWTASEIYQEYQKENSLQNNKVSTDTKELRSVKDILADPPKPHDWEDDLLNSSSIAFVIHHNGNRILFLGDANPTLVSTELDRLGYNKNNKLKLDLIKISHHGSRHNTTQDLLERISCDKYFISTDSSGPYYHPARETLILITAYGRPKENTPIYIYSNYDLPMNKLFIKGELQTLNLHFETVDHLEFPNK